jgi:hypothetical protein
MSEKDPHPSPSPEHREREMGKCFLQDFFFHTEVFSWLLIISMTFLAGLTWWA